MSPYTELKKKRFVHNYNISRSYNSLQPTREYSLEEVDQKLGGNLEPLSKNTLIYTDFAHERKKREMKEQRILQHHLQQKYQKLQKDHEQKMEKFQDFFTKFQEYQRTKKNWNTSNLTDATISWGSFEPIQKIILNQKHV